GPNEGFSRGGGGDSRGGGGGGSSRELDDEIPF
ncbi:single-stranded DNA-binding protein, partial [Mesorhizobium sp. USDA-HM6]